MCFYKYYISKEKIKFDLNYKNTVLENVKILDSISKDLSINYNIIEIETLSNEEKDNLIEKIRIFSRKFKIGVSTKEGSGALPISRGKKLNLNGFLLYISNNNIKKIYPHISNKKRLEITNTLKNHYIKKKIPDDDELKEQDISKMIETFPELIDNDLLFIDKEVEVNNGIIDCVFKKKNEDVHILVEIEIYAKSISIEQCLKFKNAYAEKYNVLLSNIKLVIICGSIRDSTFRAATACGIYIYKLNLKKMN